MNFIPYSRQYIDESDINAVIETLTSDYLTTGPKVEEFEKKICEFTTSKFSVVVSSCTAALHLASICLLNKGDKVLTTPISFLATVNSILYVDAIPVFVDIKKDGNIDLDICEEYILKDPSVKAIYSVHFSGNMVDQNKLKYLKEKYGIKILEDSAHSLGAKFTDKNCITINAGSSVNSDCSTLSFHPVKHVTTGEGGAVTTNNEEIFIKLLQLRNHGMIRQENLFINKNLAFDEKGKINPWYYEMQSLGYNYRITDFQCALGISQFDKLNDFISRRKEIADKYNKAFMNNEFVKPLYINQDSSYHLYILLIDFEKIKISRSDFMGKLRNKGIGTQVHYIPVNKQPYYQSLLYGSEYLPLTKNYYEKCLSIPIYPSLKDSEVNFVINEINCLTLNNPYDVSDIHINYDLKAI